MELRACVLAFAAAVHIQWHLAVASDSGTAHDLQVDSTSLSEDATRSAGCSDDDSHWASHGADCRSMRGLCRDPGYWGELVRASCPRTCDRCPSLLEHSPSSLPQDSKLVESMKAEAPAMTRQEADDDYPTFGPVRANTSSAWRNQTAKEEGTCTAVVKTSFAIDAKTGIAVRNATVESLGCVVPSQDVNASQESLLGLLPTNESADALSKSLRHLSPAVESTLRLVTSSNGSGNGSSIITWEEQVPSAVRRRPDSSSRRGTFKAVLNNQTQLEAANAVPANMSLPLYIVKIDERSAKQNRTANASEAVDSISSLGTRSELLVDQRECPIGFERVFGNVYGCDQWSGDCRTQAETMDDCAARCLRTQGCGSFEYSTSTKHCFRNTQTRPTEDREQGDFVFCRRAPCPSLKTKEMCLGPNVPGGYHTAEVDLQPGSYCIWSEGACQAPMACSPKDCFLPDGGLPGMPLPKRYVLWAPYAVIKASIQAGYNPLGATLLGAST
mmetsp:Transcript_31472/g.73521  ORF Transcript_31472/g.73521 Transcript_31472/m.73521 type:complete len:500 (+) Transcript_31472:54-1553(+)